MLAGAFKALSRYCGYDVEDLLDYGLRGWGSAAPALMLFYPTGPTKPRTITSIESKRDRALCQHGELKLGISHWRIHQDVEADHSMIYLDRSTEECGDNELGIPITLVGTIYLHMELRPHLYTFTLSIHLIIDAHGLLIKPRNSHAVRQRFPNFRTHFILFSLSY